MQIVIFFDIQKENDWPLENFMSFLCNELTLAEKHVYLGALAYVLNIDKKPSPEKIDYLQSKVKDVCLTAAEFKKIKPLAPKELGTKLKNIRNLIARRYILRDMILMATADHELSDTEVDAIYELGLRAGISQDKIDDIFMWAAKGVAWEIEGIRLIEEDI